MHNNRIKILHILNTSSYSGAENVVLTIIKSMDNYFKFYYTSFEGPIREKIKAADINFYPVKKMNILNIRKIVKDLKPDIIHAHDFTTSIICALSGIHVPIISHIHKNPPWLKNIGVKSIAYLLSSFRYKKILMVSDSVLNEYIFSHFIMRKSEVIGNPIDITIVKNKAKNLDSNGYDVIFLGRLSYEKSPKRFINIIEQLKTKIPGVSAAMIGAGNLETECNKLINDRNLEDSIKLLGNLENPYGILSKSKVLCITSRWEGFGLVAVEALSLGIPVVSVPVGGLTSTIKDECGKFCNDDDEFVAEISKILENDSYWKEKSIQAFKRATELDNIIAYTKYLQSLYDKIHLN